jgi:very-short-patch-repair endonuclease
MKRHIFKYDSDMKEFAKDLRKNGTPAEAILWNQLKGRKMRGYKFRRQVTIGGYVIDFFCPELMLVIEVDGSSHNGKIEKDILRQKELEDKSLTFLRYTEGDVRNNPDGVVKSISLFIEEMEEDKE